MPTTDYAARSLDLQFREVAWLVGSRNHNQYAADVDYGRAFMERMRADEAPLVRKAEPVWPRTRRAAGTASARESEPGWLASMRATGAASARPAGGPGG